MMHCWCSFLLLLAAELKWTAAGGGKIVMVGGLEGLQEGSVKTAILDVSSGNFSKLADLPDQADYGVAVLSVGSRLFAIAGNQVPNRALVYDPNSQSWKKINPLSKSVGGSAVAFTINDTMYVAGGSGNLRGLLVLRNGAFTWESGPSSKYEYDGGCGAVVESSFYTCVDKSRKCERYDAISNRWNTIPQRLAARSGSRMVELQGMLYCIGGASLKNEKFDPKTQQWSYFTAMTSYRSWHAAASDGRHIYAIGGNSGDDDTYMNTVEVYAPEMDAWHMVSYALSSKRDHMQAAFIGDWATGANGFEWLLVGNATSAIVS